MSDITSATGQIFDLSLQEYVDANICGGLFRVPTWALATRVCEAQAKTMFADNEVGSSLILNLFFSLFLPL